MINCYNGNNIRKWFIRAFSEKERKADTHRKSDADEKYCEDLIRMKIIVLSDRWEKSMIGTKQIPA